jgi:hydroxymethylbilane synthase
LPTADTSIQSGKRVVRIGSRGSQLARWQSEHIAEALRTLGHAVEIELIQTTGDRLQTIAFAKVGTKGMFTQEIEDALLEGRVDLAVHSLKDLPTQLDPRFVLAAIPKRVDPRDALVSLAYDSFASLPAAARVGTSSVRRQAQLKAHRPDLEYVEFRGNVDTRLRKLSEGQVEAIVLAAAGLDRLGRTEWVRERFAEDLLCPAPGQGALAIECRADDRSTREILASMNDADTCAAVTAEREALAALGGGCQVPIGAYCERRSEDWHISGCVARSDGGLILRAQEQGNDPLALGPALAEKLLSLGARDLLNTEGVRVG